MTRRQDKYSECSHINKKKFRKDDSLFKLSSKEISMIRELIPARALEELKHGVNTEVLQLVLDDVGESLFIQVMSSLGEDRMLDLYLMIHNRILSPQIVQSDEPSLSSSHTFSNKAAANWISDWQRIEKEQLQKGYNLNKKNSTPDLVTDSSWTFFLPHATTKSKTLTTESYCDPISDNYTLWVQPPDTQREEKLRTARTPTHRLKSTVKKDFLVFGNMKNG